MIKKKSILYIGNFAYPDKDASAHRVISNGVMLRELGFDVFFIGINKEISFESSISETELEYRGFLGWSTPYSSGLDTWIRYNEVYNRIIDVIENILKKKPDIVIFYGCSSFFILQWRLIKYFKRHKTPTISDVTDWMLTTSGGLAFRSANWVHVTLRLRYLNSKSQGVIAISRFLYDYYLKKGNRTILIPPLTSFTMKSEEFLPGEKIKLIYTGQPFAINGCEIDRKKIKDRLDITLELLIKLKADGFNFEFDIYGITKEQYLVAIPMHKKLLEGLASSVRFYQYLSHNKILEKIKHADFLILLRDNISSTEAGFPTKVSESISCGTPVITTKTSNIDEYIIEGKYGFFIDINNPNESIVKLKEIISMKVEQKIKMKLNCLNSNIFHYTSFKNDMGDFISDILSNK
jgi:glycosyltransferase involved in cell wall biosynthesis